jgi:hypothetical protein
LKEEEEEEIGNRSVWHSKRGNAAEVGDDAFGGVFEKVYDGGGGRRCDLLSVGRIIAFALAFP